MGMLSREFTKEAVHTVYSYFICEKCGADTRAEFAKRGNTTEKGNLTPDGRMYIKTIAKITRAFFTLGVDKMTKEQEEIITKEAEKALADKLEWYHKLEQGGIYPLGEASGLPLLERINGVVPFAECPSCGAKQSWAKKKDPNRDMDLISFLIWGGFFMFGSLASYAMLSLFIKIRGDLLPLPFLCGFLVASLSLIIITVCRKKRLEKKFMEVESDKISAPVIDWNGR